MSSPRIIRFYFDYVDPASYLLDSVLNGGEPLPAGAVLTHVPLEVRPPPLPVARISDDPWRSLHDEMEELAAELAIPLVRPTLIPWSRKAHELALHAREKGCFRSVHRALFEAHFVEGRDIGRVDVLVEIASERDLDRTEAKAVLDVDRFLEPVREERSEASRSGIVGVPTLLAGDRRLEGFRSLGSLEEFLAGIGR